MHTLQISIYLSIYLSVYLSVYLSTFQPAYHLPTGVPYEALASTMHSATLTGVLTWSDEHQQLIENLVGCLAN